MIPARFAPVLVAFLLSGIMSFLVSAVATFRSLGMVPDFMTYWMSAWLPAWAVAFPTLFIFRPMVMRMVGTMVRKNG